MSAIDCPPRCPLRLALRFAFTLTAYGRMLPKPHTKTVADRKSVHKFGTRSRARWLAFVTARWPRMRPTAAELEVARALIAKVKAADSSIKKADELLVCAAVACRAGEFGGVPTVCARMMGKEILRPKQVTDWVARLEKLDQAPAAESGSGLLVQPAWIEQNVPGIRELTVAPMVISPG